LSHGLTLGPPAARRHCPRRRKPRWLFGLTTAEAGRAVTAVSANERTAGA
jgi:hypothetical protein